MSHAERTFVYWSGYLVGLAIGFCFGIGVGAFLVWLVMR